MSKRRTYGHGITYSKHENAYGTQRVPNTRILRELMTQKCILYIHIYIYRVLTIALYNGSSGRLWIRRLD